MAIAMHCNLSHPTSLQSFWDVFTKSALRMRTNCYLQAYDQNSDTSGLSDPHFLHGTDIVAIGGHLLAFIFGRIFTVQCACTETSFSALSQF